MKISSIFVAFLENMNFTSHQYTITLYTHGNLQILWDIFAKISADIMSFRNSFITIYSIAPMYLQVGTLVAVVLWMYLVHASSIKACYCCCIAELKSMFAYRVYKYYCTCIYIDRTVENEVKAGKQIKVRFLTTGKDWDIKNVHLLTFKRGMT